MTSTTATTSSALANLYSSATTSSSTKKTGAASQTIDAASFLKLLTTQMTSQDPTSPMDTNTMVSQLSTLSQTTSMSEMNTSLKSLLTEVTGNRVGDAASWIGKAALLQTSTAQPLSDGSYQGELTLPSAASTVSLSFKDASGNVVHTETLTDQKAGTVGYSWDGKDSSGTAVTGPLTVSASAVGTSGSAVTPTLSTWATVTGVNSPAGGSSATLSTSVGTVSPSDVVSLS